MPWFGCTCWKRRINDCVLVACIAGSCVVPWTLRNYSVLGKPIWATTHGGYTLLLANNPSIYAHFQDQGGSRGWDPFAFHADWARHELLGELEQDSLAYELAGDTIRHNPRMFLLSSLYRLGWLWALWPHVESLVVKVVIGLWYGTLMLSALLGLGIALFGLRRRGNGEGWGAWVVPLALVISLTTIHSIFWSNMRMRAPATVALAVAAGIVGNRRQFSHCEIAELQVNSCKYS
jgi:hypothetical protein